jgi:hypothetical protein
MKRLLVTLALLAFIGLAQQPQPFNGSVSGTVAGEDGTAIVGATIALRLAPPTTSRMVRQQTNWATVTVTGGAFQLAGLPQGVYSVCPHLDNSTWLSPCEWNFPTPLATISSSNPNPTVTITLKRGVAVPVRIDDPGQFLPQNEGATPRAGLLLMLSGPGLFFRLVPLVSQDSTGRSYQIVVPPNTPLTLLVQSSFYHLNDATGTALSQGGSTKIPILVTSGQQLPPITFTIASAQAPGGI